MNFAEQFFACFFTTLVVFGILHLLFYLFRKRLRKSLQKLGCGIPGCVSLDCVSVLRRGGSMCPTSLSLSCVGRLDKPVRYGRDDEEEFAIIDDQDSVYGLDMQPLGLVHPTAGHPITWGSNGYDQLDYTTVNENVPTIHQFSDAFQEAAEAALRKAQQLGYGVPQIRETEEGTSGAVEQAEPLAEPLASISGSSTIRNHDQIISSIEQYTVGLEQAMFDAEARLEDGLALAKCKPIKKKSKKGKKGAALTQAWLEDRVDEEDTLL